PGAPPRPPDRQPPEVEPPGPALDRHGRDGREVAAAGQRQALPTRADQADPQRVLPGGGPRWEREPSLVDDDLAGPPSGRRQAAATRREVLLGPGAPGWVDEVHEDS